MTNVRRLTIENMEKKSAAMLAIVSVLFIVSYLFLVNNMIYNIVERKKTEEKIGILESKVAALESEYIKTSANLITLAYARELGFKDLSTTVTSVVKERPTLGFSLANNEI